MAITNEQLREAYRVVRQRSFDLRDEVGELMREETGLEEDSKNAHDAADALRKAVEAVRKVGGDVKDLSTKYEVEYQKYEKLSGKLASVQEELRFVREAMKHIDDTYQSFHVGMMRESQLESFYRDRARNAAALAASQST